MVLSQDSQIEKIDLVPGRVASSTSRPSTRPTGPAPLDPTDHAAIAAADGKRVTVEGVIQKVDWSKSGKVLRLSFDTDDFAAPDVLIGVAFLAGKQQLTDALEGDPAQRLTGVRVRLTGSVKRFEKGYEIIFDNAKVRPDGTVDLFFQPAKK
jgi:hypothetical protein